MPAGFVAPSSGLATQAMIEVIRQACLTAGWTVLRSDTTTDNHQLIMSSASGATVGLMNYQDAGADYYNLAAAGMIGFDTTVGFDAQPGVVISGVPAHDARIDYWFSVNARRLALVMKVGLPAVYESLYIGDALTYTRYVNYPRPLVVAGMLDGMAATRWSDTAHTTGFKGGGTAAAGVNTLRLRFGSNWLTPKAWPAVNARVSGSTGTTIKSGDDYPLLPIVLHTTANGLLAELDGVVQVPGGGLAVEDTFNIGGEEWLVFCDGARTGGADYFAMRMD